MKIHKKFVFEKHFKTQEQNRSLQIYISEYKSDGYFQILASLDLFYDNLFNEVFQK